MADSDMEGAAGVSVRHILSSEDEETFEAIKGDEQPAPGPGDEGWHFDIPADVARYLKDDEEKVIPIRHHVAVLLLPAVAAGGGLLLAIVLNSTLYYSHQAPPAAVHVIWLAWLAALGWAAYRWLNWRQTWFVITGHRLILIESVRVLGRKVTMLPISKMRDVALHQTIGGRLAGYATLDFASIGTEDALDRVDFLPWPEWLYQEISELSMPEDTRKVVKRQRGSRPR